MRPGKNMQIVNTDSTFNETGEVTPVGQVDMAYDLVKEVDCLDVSNEGNNAWEAAQKRL